MLVRFGRAGLIRLAKSRRFQFFGGRIRRVRTDHKVLALTFDDGPDPGSTTEILGILDELSVRTTFS